MRGWWLIKRFLLLLISAALALTVCGCAGEKTVKLTSLDAFDTYTELTVYGVRSKADIEKIFTDGYIRLHDVFDAYSPHEGINGVYALNNSGGEWTDIEPELMDLISFWRERRAISDKVDISLGRALDKWRIFREGGELPDFAELSALPGGADCIETDGTRARLTGGATLDVGALAKGWATGYLAAALDAAGYHEYIISAGGNVVCGARGFRVGLTDPETGGAKRVLKLENVCAVTSGDYQRFRYYEGVIYHHIIDPETLAPGGDFSQVTVICGDSALADFMSTALFLTDLEGGKALAAELGIEVIWVTREGGVVCTEGAKKFIE